MIYYKSLSDGAVEESVVRFEPSDLSCFLNCWTTNGDYLHLHISSLRFGVDRKHCSDATGKNPRQFWEFLCKQRELREKARVQLKIVTRGGIVAAVYEDSGRSYEVEVLDVDDIENTDDEEELEQIERAQALADQLASGAFPTFKDIL